MERIPKQLFFLSIIFLFSLIGVKALFHPGLFTAHDIWHQVVRLYYYYQAVNDGQLPPYWIGQLAKNFGYPIFFFSYHLPWIVGIPFLKLGITVQETVKILFVLSYLGSGLTMYFFARSLFRDNLSALLSSILYLWLPYHFLITFVGGSMGIALIFVFFPLTLLGIHKLKEGHKFGILLLSLGLAAIFLSHIMHLVFLFPSIFIFFLWNFINSKQRLIFIKQVAFGVTLGILISSFYLLPAVYYGQLTRVRENIGFNQLYKRNFINLNQLIYSKWGFSPIVNNAKSGEISFQLGIAQWMSALMLIFLIVSRRLSKQNLSLAIYLLAGLAISIFLTLEQSKFIWSFLVSFVAVDSPFRMILPASFLASIMAGLALVNFKGIVKILIFMSLIGVTLYTNRNHINVNQYTGFPIETYLNLETEITTNTFNEYLPSAANDKLLKSPWNEAYGEGISFSNSKQTTNTLSFTIDARKATNVSTGQFYFPGQTLYIDGKISKLNTDKDGLINFDVPQGIHNVMVKFQDTLIIKLSKILTIIGIITWLFLTLKLKRFEKMALYNS